MYLLLSAVLALVVVPSTLWSASLPAVLLASLPVQLPLVPLLVVLIVKVRAAAAEYPMSLAQSAAVLGKHAARHPVRNAVLLVSVWAIPAALATAGISPSIFWALGLCVSGHTLWRLASNAGESHGRTHVNLAATFAWVLNAKEMDPRWVQTEPDGTVVINPFPLSALELGAAGIEERLVTRQLPMELVGGVAASRGLRFEPESPGTMQRRSGILASGGLLAVDLGAYSPAAPTAAVPLQGAALGASAIGSAHLDLSGGPRILAPSITDGDL